MDTTRYFSDELEILMGEWLAYKAIRLYHQGTWDNRDGDGQDVTDANMFENHDLFVKGNWFLSDVGYRLIEIGVFQKSEGKHGHVRGTCSYSSIKQTIRDNIQNLDFSLFYHVTSEEFLAKSEQEYFLIEVGCEPLFEQFMRHGYCRKLDERNYWTTKIRPLMEKHKYWQGSEKTIRNTFEEELLASLSSNLKDKLYHLASKDQKIRAIKILSDETRTTLLHAKPFLEDFMFPHIWGTQSTNEPTVWKWYGESSAA